MEQRYEFYIRATPDQLWAAIVDPVLSGARAVALVPVGRSGEGFLGHHRRPQAEVHRDLRESEHLTVDHGAIVPPGRPGRPGAAGQ